MPWTTPSATEINMNAEIGGYQSDSDDDRRPFPPAPRAQADDGPAPERRPWPES
jgi:hypothetical protein